MYFIIIIVILLLLIIIFFHYILFRSIFPSCCCTIPLLCPREKKNEESLAALFICRQIVRNRTLPRKYVLVFQADDYYTSPTIETEKKTTNDADNKNYIKYYAYKRAGILNTPFPCIKIYD